MAISWTLPAAVSADDFNSGEVNYFGPAAAPAPPPSTLSPSIQQNYRQHGLVVPQQDKGISSSLLSTLTSQPRDPHSPSMVAAFGPATPTPRTAPAKKTTFQDLLARAGSSGPNYSNAELNRLSPGQRQELTRAGMAARGDAPAQAGQYSPTYFAQLLGDWKSRGSPTEEIPAIQAEYRRAYEAGNADPNYLNPNYTIMQAGGLIPEWMRRENQQPLVPNATSPAFIRDPNNPLDVGTIPQYSELLGGIRSPTLEGLDASTLAQANGRWIKTPTGTQFFDSQKSLAAAGYDPKLWGSSASTIASSGVQAPPGSGDWWSAPAAKGDTWGVPGVNATSAKQGNIGLGALLNDPTGFLRQLDLTGFSRPGSDERYSYVGTQGIPQLVKIDTRTGEATIDPTKLFETERAYREAGYTNDRVVPYLGFDSSVTQGGSVVPSDYRPDVHAGDVYSVAEQLRKAGLEGPSTLGFMDRVMPQETWQRYDAAKNASKDFSRRTLDYYQGRMSPSEMAAFAQEVKGYKEGQDPYAASIASIPTTTTRPEQTPSLPVWSTAQSRAESALAGGKSRDAAAQAVIGNTTVPWQQHPWTRAFFQSGYGDRYGFNDFERWQQPSRAQGRGDTTFVNHSILGRVPDYVAHDFSQWLKAGGGPLAKLRGASWQDAEALGYPALGGSRKVGTRGAEDVVRYNEEFGPALPADYSPYVGQYGIANLPPQRPFAEGGLVGKYATGGMIRRGFEGGGQVQGPGTETSDSIPASIDGQQPAALSTNEFVLPAWFVRKLGSGSPQKGAETLYDLLKRAAGESGKPQGTPAASGGLDALLRHGQYASKIALMRTQMGAGNGIV